MNPLPIMTQKQNSLGPSGNTLALKIQRQAKSSHRRENGGEESHPKAVPAIAKKKKEQETDDKFLAETLKKECMEKDARIKTLEYQNQLLRSNLERIKEMASQIPEA